MPYKLKRNSGESDEAYAERCRLHVNEYNRKSYRKREVKERQRSREKRVARISSGFCQSCNNPLMANSKNWCEAHWFANVAKNRLGVCLNQKEAGGKLKELLVAQGFKCAYTRCVLIPGINAALDHRQPVSRFPELQGELSNVQWVDLTVNRMKTDMTDQEFRQICQEISEQAHVN
jgi:hypothetical protein